MGEEEALGSNDRGSASARALSTRIAPVKADRTCQRDYSLQRLGTAGLAAMTAGEARPKKCVELAFNEQWAPKRGNAQLR